MEINKIIQGDALEILKTFPDNSIDMCVTSPPYFNQRDYGVKGQIGLEKNLEEYVEKLCEIFDEVKRVLKKEGSCWVNIGDCYGGYQGKNHGYPDRKNESADIPQITRSKTTAKSLLCVPEIFLIEMIKRGWLIRNKIIWFKRNVMPSSASDRFTIDYEMLYFFVKQKKYYFEQQFEPLSEATIKDINKRRNMATLTGEHGSKHFDNPDSPYSSQKTNRDRREFVGNKIPYSVQPRDKEFVDYRKLPKLKLLSKRLNEERKRIDLTIEYIETIFESQAPHHWFSAESYPSVEDWNKLKDIGFRLPEFDKQMTEVFKKSSEKKYALMPPIGGKKHLANKNPTYSGNQPEWNEYGRNKRCVWQINTKPSNVKHFAVFPEELVETPIKAGCPEGGIILDSFFGSGTTGLVALKQNKKFIGIELNPEYIEIAKNRLKPYLEQKKLI